MIIRYLFTIYGCLLYRNGQHKIAVEQEEPGYNGPPAGSKELPFMLKGDEVLVNDESCKYVQRYHLFAMV